MELTGKRIVMTGATGFIGRHVAGRLLDQGSEVYALVREASPHRELLPVHEHLHVVTGSLTEAVSCLEPVGSADGFLTASWRRAGIAIRSMNMAKRSWHSMNRRGSSADSGK